MVSRVFISTTGNQRSQHNVRVVKNALFHMDGMAIVTVTSDEVMPGNNGDRLSAAREIIYESDIFIGLYGQEYGETAPDATQSYAEAEYQYAEARKMPVVIFLPASAKHEADDRQQAFIDYLNEHHVINYFQNDDDLAAQVKLKLNDLREALAYRRQDQTIRPRPGQSLRDGRGVLPSAPQASTSLEAMASENDFKTMVEQALVLAEDDLESIFSRVLELHDARRYRDTMQDDRAGDGSMRVSPIFGEPIARSQFQADVFMIMPFRERFNQVYDNIIRPVVSELNLTIKRGDDFSSISGSIMDEVWAALNACKLVIVETTEINANVYYELGIAHTLGKPAILITQTKEVEELPFDIRHLRFIQYEDSIEGGERLEEMLKKSIIWTLNDLDERNNDNNRANGDN